MNIQLKRLLRDYKQQKIQFVIKELHSVDMLDGEKKRAGHKLYVGCAFNAVLIDNDELFVNILCR